MTDKNHTRVQVRRDILILVIDEHLGGADIYRVIIRLFGSGVEPAGGTSTTEVATRLNGRPRKRYGYEAPRRLFAERTGLSPFFVR